MKLLCLHGFLGHPSDFDFLRKDYTVFAPDLSQYVAFDFELLYQKISKKINLFDYHFMGYSFGARLAARMYARFTEENHLDPQFFKNKLICCAGHLGLGKESERLERKKIEIKFMEKILELNSSDFLTYWNELDLFANDDKLEKINFSNALMYFEKYSLSEQPYLKSILLPFKEQVLFFYGLDDLKYSKYAKNELKEYEVDFVPNTGHRILKKEDYILKRLGAFL